MLESQREKFELPRAVCYLNAAAWSPLPIAGQQAGIAGVARKGKPWLLDRDPVSRVMVPAYARPAHRRLRHKLGEIAAWGELSELTVESPGEASLGLVASGASLCKMNPWQNKPGKAASTQQKKKGIF